MRLLIALLCLLIAVPAFAQDATPQPNTQALPLAAPELLQRANAALQTQAYDRALLDYSLFIMLNPTFSRGYSGRAVTYLRQNDIDRALADLDMALSNEAEQADLRATLFGLRGRIYSQLRRFDDALENFEAALDDVDSAIELTPEEPVLFIFRGQLHTQLEDMAAAAADYFDFIRLIKEQTVTGRPMESGQGVVIPLSEGLVVEIPFEGRSGQRFNAIARPQQGSQADPLLVLLDPDGTPIRADDDGGGSGIALILDQPLEQTGTYTLILTHSLGGAQGDVGVRIELQ
jgi:tetratricopeptide (TPR) repeat protein